jgi:putative oxidoreductase
MLNRYFKAHHDTLYVVFRVVVGLLFFVHGAQKLFGWFDSKGTFAVGTMMGNAGIIELVVGLFIAVGLFSRLVALIGSVEMIAAYLIVHLPNGILPYANGGELALLYLVSFFMVIVNGNGMASLERTILRKETF